MEKRSSDRVIDQRVRNRIIKAVETLAAKVLVLVKAPSRFSEDREEEQPSWPNVVHATMNIAAVTHRAGEILMRPEFGAPRLWLTFYLTAAPAKLDEIAGSLSSLGAVNLEGSDGGFLYPKIPIEREPSVMAARVGQVLKIAASCGVYVLSVDVDTCPDVRFSLFSELVRF